MPGSHPLPGRHPPEPPVADGRQDSFQKQECLKLDLMDEIAHFTSQYMLYLRFLDLYSIILPCLYFGKIMLSFWTEWVGYHPSPHLKTNHDKPTQQSRRWRLPKILPSLVCGGYISKWSRMTGCLQTKACSEPVLSNSRCWDTI